MIVITGYYHFGLTAAQARERHLAQQTEGHTLDPTVEKNNWLAKIDIPGRRLAMKGAAGFLTDKMGHWYVIDWKRAQTEISFTVVKSGSSERHTFKLTLVEDGEYWGHVKTVGQSPKSEWATNCVAMEVTALSVPFDLPEDVLERPSLLN